ncbi:MAG: M48 family metallopeptidase [Planctomycetota bacterium]|nr:M48 family metallopeptidase [Planctomycetota bacterium]
MICSIVLLAAASVFIALIKPVFFRREKEFEEYEIYPEQEPVLFEFVGRICKLVGTDPPDQIVVDPQANAGATFASSAFDKRMRLMIGLPLACSMNTRQFAGVIAHEFGHFTQTTGMRLTYLVRSLDNWFTEAAVNRDAWDVKVEEWSHTTGAPFCYIFYLVRVVIYLARYILCLLTMVGHFFVAKLLQQMEFDADRYEARLSGSKAFAETSRRLRLLGLCQEKTLDDLDHYRRMKQLPDNFPALLVDNEKHIDDEKFREFEKELLEQETAWHDTHPSDRDRIRNAAQEQTPGTFQLEYPASLLFSNLGALCRIVTQRAFQQYFGPEFRAGEVRNTETLIRERGIRRNEGKAALRFALEQFCGFDTFTLPREKLGTAINSEVYKKETLERRKYMIDNVRY